MTAVAIVGMHRSGTSMVSRLLHDCGLYLGEEADLVPASPANLDGYWEHRRFVYLNERILVHLGGAWDRCPLLPEPQSPAWEEDEELAAVAGEAEDLIASLSSHEAWGWKDPRTSLILPFWLDAVPALKVVVCVRNPLEVAISLQRVGACSSTGEALALWRLYNERILESAPAGRTITTHAAAFFNRPQAEIKRLAAFIGLGVSDAVIREATTSVRPVLRHSEFLAGDLLRLGVEEDVTSLYASLCDLAQWTDAPAARERGPGPDGHVQVAGSARGLEELEDGLQFQFRETSRLAIELSAAREEVRSLHDELAGVRRGLEALAPLSEVVSRLHGAVEALESEVDELAAALPEDEARARARMVRRLGALVSAAVTEASRMLVLSGGDEELRDLGGPRAAHFPQGKDGAHSGWDPASSLAAIAQIEVLRARGASHLLVPASGRWWLDHYHAFDRHLRHAHDVVFDHEDVGALFELRPPGAREHGGVQELGRILGRCARELGREPAILSWCELDLAAILPERTIFSPSAGRETLPYIEDSVDLVLVEASAAPSRVEEARRVASSGVVYLDPGSAEGERSWRLRVEWSASESPSARAISLVVPLEGPSEGVVPFVRSLRETLPTDLDSELIVAHGRLPGRAQGAVDALREVAGSVVASEVGDGSFASLCATAAERARGETLVVVRPHLVLLGDWLSPLLSALRRRPDAGAVGGRILTDLGQLWHAGGILSSEGRAASIGRGEHDPDDPSYACLRAVDFCSPSLFATPLDVFRESGGFEPVPSSPDYAVADYCLRLRGRGRETYYQPDCTAVLLKAEDGLKNEAPPLPFAERHRAIQHELGERARQAVRARSALGSPGGGGS